MFPSEGGVEQSENDTDQYGAKQSRFEKAPDVLLINKRVEDKPGRHHDDGQDRSPFRIGDPDLPVVFGEFLFNFVEVQFVLRGLRTSMNMFEPVVSARTL